MRNPKKGGSLGSRQGLVPCPGAQGFGLLLPRALRVALGLGFRVLGV